MCDCIKEMEQQLSVRLLEPDVDKPWKDAEIKDVYCRSKMLSVVTGRWMITVPFVAKWTRKTKAGNEQQRETVTHVAVSYCPMCGEKAAE